MKIVSIEISNIFSIESATIDFSGSGLTLINGYNHDDDCSNGCGKSSIANSVCFGLYGKLPKNVNISDILRRGAKTGHIIITFVKNGITYSIKRCRPNKTVYYKEGIEITISQEVFEQIIGLTYDQFIKSVFSGQSFDDKFINLNDTDKKEFILKLLNFTDINKYKENVDLKIKTYKKEIEEDEKEIQIKRGTLSFCEESLLNKKEVEENIIKIKDQYSKLKEAYDNMIIQDKPDTSEIDKIELDAKNKLKEISDKKYECFLYKQKINEYEINNKNLNREIVQLNQELETPSWKKGAIEVTCPSCNNHFELNKNGVIIKEDPEYKTNIQAKIKEKQGNIKNFCELIEKTTKEMNEFELLIKNKEDKIYQLIDIIKEKRNNLVSEYNKISKQKQTLLGDLRVLETKYNNLKEQLDGFINTENTIKEIKFAIKEKEKHTKNKENILNIYINLSNILSPTGVPAYIIDNTIDLFNSYVKKYLDQLWENTEYKLITYKENSKKEIVAKLDNFFTINGQTVPIGTLSGGQKRLLMLSIDLAIINMLENTISDCFSPIFMDEAFDGLDSSNKQKVVPILEKMAENKEIVVIDHATEAKELFNREIYINYRNGLSYLE